MSLIYIPFSYIMKICVAISGNSYLFGLFFFALAFEIILFPLAIKQQKSSISMAKFRPKEKAIMDKYAGRTDRVTQQKMQQELQEMRQQEGYNPFSGCLPLLIQLPLILVLFAIVREPVQYSSSFTDSAVTQIETVVLEQHEDYKEDAAFHELFAQYTFDYVENIREHLVKDNADAKAANELLIEKLTQLGYTELEKDQKRDTYANGFEKYTMAETSRGYRELGSADIVINFGEDYVASLKEKGALDDSYDATLFPLCDKENGEKFEEMIPDFSFIGINLLATPSFSDNDTWRDWILLLIPMLVFLTSFASHKLMTKYQVNVQTDANGKPVGQGLFMSVGMPLLSAVFTLQFPAAIGTYWIWRTLISMIKTPIVNKLWPVPKLTEEEMEEAVREIRNKDKAKKKKIITIEVDEDDDSYADLEVHGTNAAPRVDSARPKTDNKKKADLPYRKPTKIEMLSADDEDTE